MREIKFRIWNKKVKTMFPWEMLLKCARNFTAFDSLIGHFNNPKVGILMQYTGLHDKNGKEIFEGDIFKHSQGIDEIKWIKDGWRVGNWEPDYLSSFDGEVIGNVFENGELLKS